MSRRKLYLSATLIAGVLSVSGMLAGGLSTTQAQSQDWAQAEVANYPLLHPNVSVAARFDISPPLRSMAAAQPAIGPVREIPERGSQPGQVSNGPQVADSALQMLYGPLTSPSIPTPIVSFDGISNQFGVAPPDTDGDVGPTQYVQMLNLGYRVYDKTGTPLTGVINNNTLWAGFGGACQTQNAGDPVVLHDQAADRWILTQFTSAAPAPFFNCIAISQTSDATGAYYRYAFTTAENSGANFGDYPKFGVWSDAYLASDREFQGGSGGPFRGLGAYAFERSQMLVGNPAARVIQFLAPNTPMYTVGDGILPVDLDGSTPPPAGSSAYFIGSQDNGGPYGAPSDALNFFKMHIDWVTPANSTFTLSNVLPVDPFDSIFDPCGSGRACIPQPGTSNKIDILSYRQRPGDSKVAYRNFGDHESLVTSTSVEAAAGIAGIRWYEIRTPGGTPTIFQQGTYAPGISDGIHRWMASIAMDSAGDMALGYSAGNATLFPSIRYTGRLSTDPLGTMPQGEASIMEGTGSQTGGGSRWGDYSAMHIDPTDDCTFWYTTEYVPTTSERGWRGRIGSFKFPNCGAGGGTATPTVTAPVPTATRTNTATNTVLVPSATTTRTGTATNTVLAPSATTTRTNTVVPPTATCVPAAVVPHTVGLGGAAGARNLVSKGNGSAQLKAGSSSNSSRKPGVWNPTAPISFILDDGSQENSVGLNDMVSSFPAIYVNRFSPANSDFPLTLNQISIQFPDAASAGRNLVGLSVDLLVYLDADRDNDPSNATKLAQLPVTITVADGTTFSNFPVSIVSVATGDLYIGFADTYNSGGQTPLSYPAPIDTTTTQTRSWVSAMSASADPDYDNLANNDLTGTIDDFGLPGNWIIRASGDTQTGGGCPTSTPVQATATAEPSATSTACAISFTDVPPDSTFYQYIRCLACRGIISGYDDSTFRPNNDITRGQIAKMVSNAAGFNDDPGPQIYEDVDSTNTFYTWINRLSNLGFMGGYPCGTIDPEPCNPPENRPYFRPFANATRGQLAKIVSNAAGLSGTPTGVFYTDVQEDNTFYVWIMRLTDLGVMSGYDCGGPGEPCDSQNRPYFRPFNNVTRGQASKIVANTFLPGCETPAR